jgi:hypothetical protein
MAVTSLASSDGASPVGDENLVGGGQFHRAQTIENELDRDLKAVHRCSTPAAGSPHTARIPVGHRQGHHLHFDRSARYLSRLRP